MDKEEMIWIASVVVEKRLDYETLNYSDYMYGNEDKTDEVWDYVSECLEVGIMAFKEKYSEYKMYF